MRNVLSRFMLFWAGVGCALLIGACIAHLGNLPPEVANADLWLASIGLLLLLLGAFACPPTSAYIAEPRIRIPTIDGHPIVDEPFPRLAVWHNPHLPAPKAKRSRRISREWRILCWIWLVFTFGTFVAVVWFSEIVAVCSKLTLLASGFSLPIALVCIAIWLTANLFRWTSPL